MRQCPWIYTLEWYDIFPRHALHFFTIFIYWSIHEWIRKKSKTLKTDEEGKGCQYTERRCVGNGDRFTTWLSFCHIRNLKRKWRSPLSSPLRSDPNGASLRPRHFPKKEYLLRWYVYDDTSKMIKAVSRFVWLSRSRESLRVLKTMIVDYQSMV